MLWPPYQKNCGVPEGFQIHDRSPLKTTAESSLYLQKKPLPSRRPTVVVHPRNCWTWWSATRIKTWMTGRLVGRTGQRTCEFPAVRFCHCHLHPMPSGKLASSKSPTTCPVSMPAACFGMAGSLQVPGGDLVEDHSYCRSYSHNPNPQQLKWNQTSLRTGNVTSEPPSRPSTSTWKSDASKSYRASVHPVSATPKTIGLGFWPCQLSKLNDITVPKSRHASTI